MMMKYNSKYWKETLQPIFCEYIDCKDPIEKNRIYNKHLHEPFLEMVEYVVNKYDERINFYSSDLKHNLKNDTLAFLVMHVQKFNTKKSNELIKEKGLGYGFGYCLTLVKAHMHDRLKKEYNKHRTFESFDELEDYDEIKIPD